MESIWLHDPGRWWSKDELLAIVQTIKLSGAAKLRKIVIITDSLQKRRALDSLAQWQPLQQNFWWCRQMSQRGRYSDSLSLCFLWCLAVGTLHPSFWIGYQNHFHTQRYIFPLYLLNMLIKPWFQDMLLNRIFFNFSFCKAHLCKVGVVPSPVCDNYDEDKTNYYINF